MANNRIGNWTPGCLQFVTLMFWVLALAGCADWEETEPVPKDSPERVKFGQYYDLKRYEKCRAENPRSSNCDKYKLVRKESPEYWPNPNVPLPKWPDPPAEQTYRKGMNRVEYFNALCEKEAGEFIYKTIENVEGIYQIRPRELPEPGGYVDKYAIEDPYGAGQGDQDWAAFRRLIGPTDKRKWAYLYFERPIQTHPISIHERASWHESMWIAPPKEAKYVLYYGGEASGKDKSFRAIYSDKLTSKIGFTWREIRRPHDLEIGVKGGELMVVDLQSGEVLGIRRGFIAALERKFGSWQGWSGAICPSYGDKPGYGGRNKDSTSTYWFITKVAKPKISASFKPDGESK